MAHHPFDQFFNAARSSGGSFFTFLALLGFTLTFLLSGFEIVAAVSLKTVKEIIECINAENGIKGNSVYLIRPSGNTDPVKRSETAGAWMQDRGKPGL